MKRAVTAVAMTLIAGIALCQTPLAPVVVESFRKKNTRILERTEQVHLSLRDPLYETVVKDAAGGNRFQLSISPIRVGQEDPSIVAWHVSLVDMHRTFYGNLLLPNRDSSLNQGPKGNATRLDPNTYAVVPVRAKRIIKVDNFYCIIEVEDFRLVAPERWHLDSMDVEVHLTNTNPLTGSN